MWKLSLLLCAALLAGGLLHLACPRSAALLTEAHHAAFQRWKLKLGKNYASPTEQEYRLSVFAANLKKIEAHQAQADKTFSMGLNHFADLTSDEFRSKMTLSSVGAIESLETAIIPEQENALGQTPNIDYRDQLQQQSINTSNNCNSNYAWIAAVNMNANYYLRNPVTQRYALSPQTYLDCSANFGNQGCTGGNTLNCYAYSQVWGVDTMTNYPYYGVQRPCKASTGYFRNQGTYRINSLSNTDLYKALAGKNVISVLVDASSMQFYTSGIFMGPCTTDVNHNMLLVGAGSVNSNNYWLLMNTWSAFWGENGFMRLGRFTVDGNPEYSSCGLNMYAHYPTF